VSAGQNPDADPAPVRRRPAPVARSLAWALVLLLPALLLWWGLWPQADTAGERSSGVAAVAPAPAVGFGAGSRPLAGQQAPDVSHSDTAHWPVSLIGSAPDGEPELDASGRLRPSRGLRRLFDYFLAAQGEREPSAIRQLLADDLGARFPATLVAEVMGEFDRYLDYQGALATLPPETDMIARLDALVALRRRWFDAATAEAFFGNEERMTRYTLERLAIARDPDRDAGERQARLNALAASVPAEQAALAAEAETALGIAEQDQQLDARSADAATRHAERKARFGEAAAERLARLDQDRARWDARLAVYRQAREAIRADPGLGPAEISAATAALRAAGFDPNEQRRILSLEAIGQL